MLSEEFAKLQNNYWISNWKLEVGVKIEENEILKALHSQPAEKKGPACGAAKKRRSQGEKSISH